MTTNEIEPNDSPTSTKSVPGGDCGASHCSLFSGFDPDEHDLLTMDGYDKCVVGIVEQFGRPPIVCYDKNKVLAQLMADGCSEEEAVEFFEFNQIGAYVGDSTPCFLSANTTMSGVPGDTIWWWGDSIPNDEHHLQPESEAKGC